MSKPSFWSSLLALAAAIGIAAPAFAAEPAPAAITPDLVKLATGEAKVVFYTSVELVLAEHIGKLFEKQYPGISVQIERTGSERVFQRIAQEASANIHSADVVNTSDASHFVYWKRQGTLAPYLPAEVAEKFPATARDGGGFYATWRSSLSPIAYNTSLVKEADAPKSYRDLLDPKWKGKIVKANPNYSGVIMTSTYETALALGWSYFEELAKQDVMQLQSALEPPRKVGSGEREIMFDGSENYIYALIDKGNPIKIVYPTEGVPLVASPAAILKDAPHPNAARLFYAFIFSQEVQQLMVNEGGIRSFHSGVKDRSDQVPLSTLKIWPEDAEAIEKNADEIKERYRKIFGT